MTRESACRLRELEWDTGFFGIRIGELDVGTSTASDVEAHLSAQAGAFDLIYVRGATSEIMSDDLLRTFNGQQTDTRVEFRMSPIAIPETRPSSVEGTPRVAGAEDFSENLVRLAVLGSEHSRFRTDEHFQDAWVDALYRTWIEKSVAQDPDVQVLLFSADEELIGFHSIRFHAAHGSHELFAVDPSHRGRGVGTALWIAGLRAIRDRGFESATVTTQLDNPACEMYRRFGYSLTSTENIYHLWPRLGTTDAASSIPHDKPRSPDA